MRNLKLNKQDLESITYSDILKYREDVKNCPIKIEDLEMNLFKANQYLEVMREFLEELNFSDDRLELEIEFKSPKGMKQKLNRILKESFVQKLKKT